MPIFNVALSADIAIVHVGVIVVENRGKVPSWWCCRRVIRLVAGGNFDVDGDSIIFKV